MAIRVPLKLTEYSEPLVDSQWDVFLRHCTSTQMDAMLEIISHGQTTHEWRNVLEEVRKRLHIASVEGTLKVRSVTGTDKHERL